MPIQPPEARPAAAAHPPASVRRGAPASGACQPAATTTTHPATPGGSGGWEGRVTGRLPGVRLRVKGAGRDAAGHRPRGRGLGVDWRPGRPSRPPAPAACRVQGQADAVQPSLTSSPGGSTPQGDKKKISAAQSPRKGDAGAAAPHTIPARLSGRPGVRPGFSPREPPYYRATKLRALPSPPQLSASPSLLSLSPCSRLSPHLPDPLSRALSAPPSPPTGGGWGQ